MGIKFNRKGDAIYGEYLKLLANLRNIRGEMVT